MNFMRCIFYYKSLFMCMHVSQIRKKKWEEEEERNENFCTTIQTQSGVSVSCVGLIRDHSQSTHAQNYDFQIKLPAYDKMQGEIFVNTSLLPPHCRAGEYFVNGPHKFNSTKMVCAPAPDKFQCCQIFRSFWIPDAMLPIRMCIRIRRSIYSVRLSIWAGYKDVFRKGYLLKRYSLLLLLLHKVFTYLK